MSEDDDVVVKEVMEPRGAEVVLYRKSDGMYFTGRGATIDEARKAAEQVIVDFDSRPAFRKHFKLNALVEVVRDTNGPRPVAHGRVVAFDDDDETFTIAIKGGKRYVALSPGEKP